jgi:Tfp pilus assembly pilus retraction ATPase PilT
MSERGRWLIKGSEFDSFSKVRETLFPSSLLADAEGAKRLDDVMLVRRVNPESGEIESAIRWLFVWSVMNRGSDIHMTGVSSKKSVTVSCRTPKGMLNFRYVGGEHGAFRDKMFNLSNIPQGGSTPSNVPQRFPLIFPRDVAGMLGLRTKPGYDAYDVQVRVEYIKSHDGWTFVVRLIDQQFVPELEDMKLPQTILSSIHKIISQPSGLILVTGPTGSGKTTLLYALISRLNNGQRAITTIENPVELIYDSLDYSPVKQIQVEGDLSFARALRSALRQDPDIIMIGEIRDQETMEIALQAAQTGHLVFATLHANNGIETISRACDLTMDKERDAYRLAENLKLVIAARLIELFECTGETAELNRSEAEWLALNAMSFVDKAPAIDLKKRRGRQSIMEVIEITPEIKAEIRKSQINSTSIFQHACEQLQFETLPMAGVRLVQGKDVAANLGACMTSLDPASDANTHRPLRLRLAEEFGLTLPEVNERLNAYVMFREEHRHDETSLHAFFERQPN